MQRWTGNHISVRWWGHAGGSRQTGPAIRRPCRLQAVRSGRGDAAAGRRAYPRSSLAIDRSISMLSISQSDPFSPCGNPAPPRMTGRHRKHAAMGSSGVQRCRACGCAESNKTLKLLVLIHDAVYVRRLSSPWSRVGLHTRTSIDHQKTALLRVMRVAVHRSGG